MKYLICLTICFTNFCDSLFAQIQSNKLYTDTLYADTLYASSHTTLSLLFPQGISLTDIGSSDYLFQQEGNLLIIKAQQPTQRLTSLLVRYGQGDYFTAWLGYQQQPKQFIYDLRKLRIDTHIIDTLPSVSLAVPQTGLDTTAAQLQLDSFLLLPAETYAKGRKQEKKQGLNTELELIRTGKEFTFLRLKIQNTSSLPYQVRATQLQIKEARKKRGLGGILKEITPVVSSIPELIPPGEQRTFAFVFPHFATSKNAVLELSLREANGTRSIQFPISTRHILDAKTID